MANTDNPNGLRPVRHYLGAEVQTRPYRIASGLAANIGLNDPVKSTGTTKRVTVATAGDTIRGVFAGVQYTDTNGNVIFSKNWVSGTATKDSAEAVALVYDDPWILYEAQTDGAFAETNIGLNADLVFGTPVNGVSIVEVDNTTYTTAAAQVKIVDYVRDGINEATTNAKLLVLINEHEFKGSTAGV